MLRDCVMTLFGDGLAIPLHLEKEKKNRGGGGGVQLGGSGYQRQFFFGLMIYFNFFFISYILSAAVVFVVKAFVIHLYQEYAGIYGRLFCSYFVLELIFIFAYLLFYKNSLFLCCCFTLFVVLLYLTILNSS